MTEERLRCLPTRVAGIERSEPPRSRDWGLDARFSCLDPRHPNAEVVLESSLSTKRTPVCHDQRTRDHSLALLGRKRTAGPDWFAPAWLMVRAVESVSRGGRRLESAFSSRVPTHAVEKRARRVILSHACPKCRSQRGLCITLSTQPGSIAGMQETPGLLRSRSECTGLPWEYPRSLRARRIRGGVLAGLQIHLRRSHRRPSR